MPGFDLKSAVPIAEQNGVATKEPEFDINTAMKMTEPVADEDGYDAFTRSQFHQQIKDSINRPLSAGETSFIQDTEAKDPGALQSFLIPYTEGVVGFFTKPFGYRPDLSRPFGLEKGPKPPAEAAQDITMQKEHPVAFTLGQVVAGTAPFIATAPLFPANLLGTLATFETVGLINKIGQQQTDETLLMPAGEKAKELGIEAIKSGVMAPIWHYSGALKFIGRPFLSAMTRAGVRGVGTVGLESVFGTDLEQALKQGGMITALSLIFEAPYLAKTALGRGIINRAADIAEVKGLKPTIVNVPGKGEVINTWGFDVDKMDAAATRTSIFDLVKTFYKLMRTKIEKPAGPVDPARQATYDRLTYTPEMPSNQAPGEAGGAIWVPRGVYTPSGNQPKVPILALKLKDGTVVSDETVNMHNDILTNKGLNPDDVQDVGVVDEKGAYHGIKLLDAHGGTPLETLPEVPIDLLRKVQGILLGEVKKQPYEMTQEEFNNIPIIKYIKSSLKKGDMTIAERDKLGEQLVEQGIMSIDDFNAMTGQHGFGGVTGVKNLSTDKPIPSKPVDLTTDMGARLNTIGQWHTFRVAADWFAHRHSILKALEEEKSVPKNVLAEYIGWTSGTGKEKQTEWAVDALRKLYPGENTEKIIKIGNKISKLNSEHPDLSKTPQNVKNQIKELEQERNKLSNLDKPSSKSYTISEGESKYYEVSEGKGKGLSKFEVGISQSPLKVKYKEQGYFVFPQEKVNSPADVAFAFQQLKNEAVERFYVVGIKDDIPVSVEPISIGTLNTALVSTFEPLHLLLLKKADSYYLVHNHPSGEVNPSVEDVTLTRKFIEAYKKSSLEFKGHVIIDDTKFGLIDKDFTGSTEEHLKDAGKGKKIASYSKYLEWVKPIPSDPGITSPESVFSLVKGINTDWEKNSLVLYLNTRNNILASEILPHSKIEAALLAQSAVSIRAPQIIIANSGIPDEGINQLTKNLSLYDIDLVDMVNFDNKKNFISKKEAGFIVKEKPGEYKSEQPSNQRIEQRKADMEIWNTPDITGKMLASEKEFLKKYIDEKKSLKQIAKELGENIEDVKKTEMWAYAHMQEITDELRAEMEEAGTVEENFIKNQIKDYLKGKLDPALKEEGEYNELKLLPWLFGDGGQRPDVLATELGGIIGAPLETEQDVIDLIKAYFNNEIQGRAVTSEAKESKAARVKLQKDIARTSKPSKAMVQKPEREITGVGNGSVISTKDDIDYAERKRIFEGMPFALLGNKAEVLARLPSKFKAALKEGIKKVYDLWGGAKGYRSGLFSDIPAENYILNELSDERFNYYKNIQDPQKQAVMKQTITNIMNDFTSLMKEAFNLPPAKDNKDFLDMLNSWLKMGLRKERYYFTREVIQEFGDKLLQEAAADKFVSPESSAKYYFLENASIFSINKTDKGYSWTQGIIRTTKGESAIRNIVDKLVGFNEHLDNELKRDKGMSIIQGDAWDEMDKLTGDIKSGKVNAEETVVVIVDPQYLNPSESAGTYSVGASDTAWPGHKQNLENHLLPLVKTGVKIIYTNNADYELLKWMRGKKLPYNINKSIGAVAERSGRDEIISFINFKFPQQYVSGAGAGAEWTLGQAQPGGAGAPEQGQQYVAERVTGQSNQFVEWLREHELKLQEEARKQELIAKIKLIAKSKMLSNITVSRIKNYLGIKEWKNTDIPQIQKVVDYLEGLKVGDRLLSQKQIDVLKGLLDDVKDLAIMPKRIAIEQFGNNPQLLEGLIMSRIANELVPTVDIKEGHPLVQKILNEVNERLESAEEEIRIRDNQLEELLTKAEKSRKLPAGERTKRFFTSQNKEIFRALSGEKVDLTKEEMAVVEYLKDFFAMAKEKLGLQKYRKNYITHMEQPLTEKILEKGLIGALRQYFDEQAKEKGIPTDIMLELDNIIGSEKFFRYALQRKGGIEPTTNIRKIVHGYSSLFETKMALDRILPLGQVATQLIIQGRSALWLKKFLQNLKGRGLDYEFRSGKMGWLSRVADAIVDLGYIKLLSLNYYSAIKNIIAGETNSMIWQDFSTYLKGKQRLISNPKKAYEIAVEHGVLEGTYADYTQRGIGKLKKLQDLAMIGQQAGEVEIRTTLFISELTDQEWKTGDISSIKSRKLRDIVAITQGVFSKTESPLWVQTVLGRTIMQMNRWRITDAMLLRRIVNGAKEEWSQGNFKGQNSYRLGKALFFYALGMYASYELAKAGFKKAGQIAQSMAEVINSLISLISQGDLSRMITDNPTLSVMKEFFFTAQALAKYLHVPGAQKPNKIRIQHGIEDTYMAPVQTTKDLIDSLTQ